MSTDPVHELNARTNEQLRRLALTAAVLFLVLNAVIAGGVAWAVFDVRDSARTNGHILTVVLAVTGCTVDDTPEECKTRFRNASFAEGARRIAEVDCAARRRQAGLPAVVPADTCTSQTPPSVYPGLPAE